MESTQYHQPPNNTHFMDCLDKSVEFQRTVAGDRKKFINNNNSAKQDLFDQTHPYIQKPRTSPRSGIQTEQQWRQETQQPKDIPSVLKSINEDLSVINSISTANFKDKRVSKLIRHQRTGMNYYRVNNSIFEDNHSGKVNGTVYHNVRLGKNHSSSRFYQIKE